MEADDTVLLFKGKKVSRARADAIKVAAEALTRVFREGFTHCDFEVQGKILQYRREIGEVLVGIEEMSFDSDRRQPGNNDPVGQSSPLRSSTEQRGSDVPVAALEFERRNVIYLLDLISDEELIDVEAGIDIETEKLKDLHDVKVHEVKGIIKDLRDAAGKYAARRGCDERLVHRAQLQCERAFEWTRQVVACF
jgi:hypothetical protein